MISANNRGFTLVETLVYLAIFALIMTGLLVTAYALFESSSRAEGKAMVQDEADFLMSKIIFALNNAQTICTPSAGASGSSLSIATYGGSCGAVTVSTTSSDVYLNSSRLNNDNVSLNRLRFIHTSSGSLTSLEIDLDATARSADGRVMNLSASTTKYIRK